MNVIEMFEDAEKEFWTLKIKGINYWHIVRMSVFELVQGKGEHIGQAHPDHNLKMSFKEKVGVGFLFLVNSLFRHPLVRFKKKKNYFIVCVPRKTLYKGRYICTTMEPVLESLKGEYNYLERPSDFRHKKDIGRRCLAYSDYMEIKRFINLKKKTYFLNEEEKNIVKRQVGILNKKLGTTLTEAEVIDCVNRSLTGYFTYYNEYKKILRKYRPKYIVETTHYETAKLSLNVAAHEMGIKVFELQHGVMNIQYNIPQKDDFIPDEVLTFGEYWNQTTCYPGKMVAIGNPHLEECVTTMKTIKYFPTILILSQGPVGEALVKLAIELKNLVRKKGIPARIIYKLHPNEYISWKKIYPELVGSEIEVVDNNEKDLYYYFSISTHQIGVFSTAIYEGMAFGVKTIIYKAYRYETMKDIIEAGYAKLADDGNSVLNEIMNKEEQKVPTEMIWKSNALSNLKKELLG